MALGFYVTLAACVVRTVPAPPGTLVDGPAVAARLAVGERTMVEIVVPGAGPASRSACAVLLADQRRAFPETRILRPCDAARLPEADPPGVALYVAQPIDAGQLVLLGAGPPDALPRHAFVQTILLVDPATEATCEVSKRALRERLRRDAGASRERARLWIWEQLERAEERATRACAAAADKASRCATIADAMERSRCDLEKDHLARACTSARTEIAALKQREASDPAEYLPHIECR